MRSSPKSSYGLYHHGTEHEIESEGEEEEDAPERRGFQDGVDLRLGAIEQTNARKRERERERERERDT